MDGLRTPPREKDKKAMSNSHTKSKFLKNNNNLMVGLSKAYIYIYTREYYPSNNAHLILRKT